MKLLSTVVSCLLLTICAQTYAQPNMEVTAVAEKEVVVVQYGRQVTRRIPAESIKSNEELIYTLRYHNSGAEKATAVALDNPVPRNTSYITDSAFGAGAIILFSLDGKHFDKPSLLTYTTTDKNGKTEKHVASPDQFSHLRWVLNEVPAGASGQVGFRVKVK